MVVESLLGLEMSSIEKIHLVVLREHLKKYKCEQGILTAFREANLEDKLEIVVLDKETKSQPETVYRALQEQNIDGSFYIKDTDNFFVTRLQSGNIVSTYDINKMDLVHASNKSFVTADEKRVISNIVEKQVISSKFCVGGYGFSDSKEFIRSYERLENNSDLYVSHIIFDMMLNGAEFQNQDVESYIDWGTIKEWNDFKSQYATIFIDLDGVLVENSSSYFEPIWGTTESIQENVDAINKLYHTGKVKIIITTARKSAFKEATLDQLKRLGIKYHQIIFDLLHSKRIIVNDYAKSNPYKSCDAININRNSSELKQMIKDTIGAKI